MEALALQGGFSDASVEAALAFRAVMRAMARPGTVEHVAGAVPPAPLSAAAGVVMLTLCDPGTPVHLAGEADCAAVRDWITFHTGAPLVGRERAAFAVGTWPDLLPLEGYPMGLAEYPDRSATLIVELNVLEARGARLTGPGIAREVALSLPETVAFQANAARYPLGLDFVLTCGDRLAALPRTTRVEAN
ncbi:alpha-D-ribose 1-methylphosphonate 5-triphosphate synthase subunit PhnH [Roseovarius azorensis]|uniref:Alpha-D-ribose 1-methylphosphonate 5-triphosphate synthase subunit PhnH n=1 Tax=Roseovarius azorensis TaxID=1287727 RepID=A0A1H7UBW0_9RHOB|nr:phosphonate C-P lyase system protein PhnH [Roseovarius azorensis]SEL94309.1 alpha-D-ribose 1-methylphosphonate 5-triphosphate synthase subunit PhnH [Roseovarius azorensis]